MYNNRMFDRCSIYFVVAFVVVVVVALHEIRAHIYVHVHVHIQVVAEWIGNLPKKANVSDHEGYTFQG